MESAEEVEDAEEEEERGTCDVALRVGDCGRA